MTVFAPHVTSPQGNEVFNLGKVTITWDRNDPPTDDPYGAVSVISYEIEYTDNYKFEDTVWNTIKRRIPWVETEFEWVVGKMVKSATVRIRIRAKNSLNGEQSDWSAGSGDFSINVFKLIPPAIVSPLPSHVYTDFILIILDESITRDTFNQKVRYTLEYSSKKRGIDWTTIALNIPVGQNVIRWGLEDIPSSDDFILRLTAKNASTSCIQTAVPTSDQISRRFVYNLKIQQPGMFLIDTVPPQTTLDIEGSSGITNQLTHTLNIYAEDGTTEVEQVQIRECDASNQVALGNVDNISTQQTTDCMSIEDLIADPDADFGKLIGKPLGYSTKTQWSLEDKSGLRRLEALVTDSGGNTSVQDLRKTFIPIFRSDTSIEDIVITTETRETTTINQSGEEFEIITKKSQFEVAYLSGTDGTYWILEPSPRRIAKSVSGRQILALFVFGGFVYLFTYINSDEKPDQAIMYRDDTTVLTPVFIFPNPLPVTNAVAEFQDIMYVGLESGELWKFDSAIFTLVKTFANPISTLIGDNEHLYIGQSNSSQISLYDGTSFFDSDVET